MNEQIERLFGVKLTRCDGCYVPMSERVYLPDNWNCGHKLPEGLTVHTNADGERFAFREVIVSDVKYVVPDKVFLPIAEKPSPENEAQNGKSINIHGGPIDGCRCVFCDELRATQENMAQGKPVDEPELPGIPKMPVMDPLAFSYELGSLLEKAHNRLPVGSREYILTDYLRRCIVSYNQVVDTYESFNLPRP